MVDDSKNTTEKDQNKFGSVKLKKSNKKPSSKKASSRKKLKNKKHLGLPKVAVYLLHIFCLILLWIGINIAFEPSIFSTEAFESLNNIRLVDKGLWVSCIATFVLYNIAKIIMYYVIFFLLAVVFFEFTEAMSALYVNDFHRYWKDQCYYYKVVFSRNYPSQDESEKISKFRRYLDLSSVDSFWVFILIPVLYMIIVSYQTTRGK